MPIWPSLFTAGDTEVVAGRVAARLAACAATCATSNLGRASPTSESVGMTEQILPDAGLLAVAKYEELSFRRVVRRGRSAAMTGDMGCRSTADQMYGVGPVRAEQPYSGANRRGSFRSPQHAGSAATGGASHVQVNLPTGTNGAAAEGSSRSLSPLEMWSSDRDLLSRVRAVERHHNEDRLVWQSASHTGYRMTGWPSMVDALRPQNEAAAALLGRGSGLRALAPMAAAAQYVRPSICDADP